MNDRLSRRQLLLFFGASAGAIAAHGLGQPATGARAIDPNLGPGANLWPGLEPADATTIGTSIGPGVPFEPIQLPLPLRGERRSPTEQARIWSKFVVQDDLVLAKGYHYDVITSWGDRLADSHVGYNCDYLSVLPRGQGRALLTINFEYISPKVWLATYEQVLGQTLPIATVKAALNNTTGEKGVVLSSLAAHSPERGAIETISRAALKDLGIGIVALHQDPSGRWHRSTPTGDPARDQAAGQPSHQANDRAADQALERRIDGLTGFDRGQALRATGPAVAVFRKTQVRGYRDRWGDRIVGTFGNCAGGTSPWGTVFSAEENFQNVVLEPVHADGSAFDPETHRFVIDDDEIFGCGSVFGLAGNKYGWIVEIDPTNPQDPGTKHTSLGRYRHEAVAIRAEAGQKLAVYSTCDRRAGHVYKFVSQGTIVKPEDKANSRLLTAGTLYVAKFEPDGTGHWLPLRPETPVRPVLPSQCVGGVVTLPKRPDGGIEWCKDDRAIADFQARFATLGDLYEGNPEEKQGAILIDAHFAANAIGGTCTARPEDAEVGHQGQVFITFTSGSNTNADGGPDRRIFHGPKGETPYEYGWVFRLDEANNDPAALQFRWQAIATGGEPAAGGDGFSNPDNLAFDSADRLWIVTDIAGDKMNRPIPAGRTETDGQPISQPNLRGVFGNNSLWCLPLSGRQAGHLFPFGYGPMDAELTGPFWFQDTLFLAVQHPGETRSIRQNNASQTIELAMTATDGSEFIQTRQVPIGSNWPSGRVNGPPRPSVVAIYHSQG